MTLPSAHEDSPPARALAARLSAVPGVAVRAAEPLARYTTLRIGGPAEWLVEIPSQRALLAVVRLANGTRTPFHLLGLGSNVLVPDEGLPGIVGRLGGELKRARVRGDLVSAGAALPLPQLARRMAARGLLGLEALSGFPSTVGGAVCMNAGCYGTEIKDVLVSASIVERDGTARRITLAELEPAYRTTVLQRTGALVTRAVFGSTAATRRRRWRASTRSIGSVGRAFLRACPMRARSSRTRRATMPVG